MAKNKGLRTGNIKEQVLTEIERVHMRGFTGRAGGPRRPREIPTDYHKDVAGAGIRKMNLTDPDDNVMEHYPTKRELAMQRGKRKRKMHRR